MIKYDFTFLILFYIIFTDLMRYVTLKSSTPRTEEALFEIANQLCLENTGYQPLERNAYFRVEETTLNGTVTLPCGYCVDGGDDGPRIWSWRQRQVDAEEAELEMGLGPNLTDNRIFTLPDNSLTIRLVTTNDTGLYYCRSPMEGDTSEVHFSLDVVSDQLNVVEQKEGFDFSKYTEDIIVKANKRVAKEENIAKHFDKVIVKIVSEWDPWGPCDGCVGLRRRFGRCRVRPQLNKAKYPDISEEKLSNTQKLLLNSIVVSCRSLDLAKWFPDLYRLTSDLPDFRSHQECHDVCHRENVMPYEARQKLDLEIDVGASYSFICPDADLRSKVVWRKDGLRVKTINAPRKPKKNKFKFPFSKKKEFNLEHAFVDRMNVLRLCYVGKEESGVYICYMDNKPVKAFNITVATPREVLRERYVHFVMLSTYTACLSGAMVLVGIGWRVWLEMTSRRRVVWKDGLLTDESQNSEHTETDHTSYDKMENIPEERTYSSNMTRTTQENRTVTSSPR